MGKAYATEGTIVKPKNQENRVEKPQSKKPGIQSLFLDVNWPSVMGFARRALPWIVSLSCWAQTTPAAPRNSRATSHPNVVLITLDTTRADRMGFLGSDRGLTPNLDALARAATVFSRAYAQVPLTTPSHATILTGT